VLVVDKTRDLKGRPRSGVQRQYTGR
jgi:hypothetical protein